MKISAIGFWAKMIIIFGLTIGLTACGGGGGGGGGSKPTPPAPAALTYHIQLTYHEPGAQLSSTPPTIKAEETGTITAQVIDAKTKKPIRSPSNITVALVKSDNSLVDLSSPTISITKNALSGQITLTNKNTTGKQQTDTITASATPKVVWTSSNSNTLTLTVEPKDIVYLIQLTYTDTKKPSQQTLTIPSTPSPASITTTGTVSATLVDAKTIKPVESPTNISITLTGTEYLTLNPSTSTITILKAASSGNINLTNKNTTGKQQIDTIEATANPTKINNQYMVVRWKSTQTKTLTLNIEPPTPPTANPITQIKLSSSLPHGVVQPNDSVSVTAELEDKDGKNAISHENFEITLSGVNDLTTGDGKAPTIYITGLDSPTYHGSIALKNQNPPSKDTTDTITASATINGKKITSNTLTLTVKAPPKPTPTNPIKTVLIALQPSTQPIGENTVLTVTFKDANNNNVGAPSNTTLEYNKGGGSNFLIPTIPTISKGQSTVQIPLANNNPKNTPQPAAIQVSAKFNDGSTITSNQLNVSVAPKTAPPKPTPPTPNPITQIKLSSSLPDGVVQPNDGVSVTAELEDKDGKNAISHENFEITLSGVNDLTTGDGKAPTIYITGLDSPTYYGSIALKNQNPPSKDTTDTITASATINGKKITSNTLTLTVKAPPTPTPNPIKTVLIALQPSTQPIGENTELTVTFKDADNKNVGAPSNTHLEYNNGGNNFLIPTVPTISKGQSTVQIPLANNNTRETIQQVHIQVQATFNDGSTITSNTLPASVAPKPAPVTYQIQLSYQKTGEQKDSQLLQASGDGDHDIPFGGTGQITANITGQLPKYETIINLGPTPKLNSGNAVSISIPVGKDSGSTTLTNSNTATDPTISDSITMASMTVDRKPVKATSNTFTLTVYGQSTPTPPGPKPGPANVKITRIQGISSTLYQGQTYTPTFTLENLGTTSIDISDLIVRGDGAVSPPEAITTTTPCPNSLTNDQTCPLKLSVTTENLGPGKINITSTKADISITKNIFIIPECLEYDKKLKECTEYSSNYMAVRINNAEENSLYTFYLAAQADSQNAEANPGTKNLQNITFTRWYPPATSQTDSDTQYYLGKYDSSTNNKKTAWTKNAEKLASTTDQSSNTIFYIPKGSSGTMYLSYGFPIQDNPSNGAPNPINIDSQPPFQEIEYTYKGYDDANSSAQAYWFDLTNINAFAIPLSLEGFNVPSEEDGGTGNKTPTNVYNNEIHGIKKIPYQNKNNPVAILSMQNILTDIKAIFNKPPWSNLIQTDNNNEALRGLVGPATVAANDGPFKHYLKDYIDALKIYYSDEKCTSENQCLWINPEYTNPDQDLDCTLVKGYYSETKQSFEFIPDEGSQKTQKCSFTGPNPFIASPLTNGVGPENALTLTASQVWFLSNSAPTGNSALKLDKQGIYRALYSARVAGFLPGSSPWSKSNPMSLANIGKQIVSHSTDATHPNNSPSKLQLADTSKKYYGYYSAVISKYSNVYAYTFSDFLNQSGLLNVFNNGSKPLQPLTIYITPLGKATQHPQAPKPPGYNVIMVNHANTTPTYTNSAPPGVDWTGHPLDIISSAVTKDPKNNIIICKNRFQITTDQLNILKTAIKPNANALMPNVSFSTVNLTRLADDKSQHRYELTLAKGTLSVTQTDSLMAFKDPSCMISVSGAPASDAGTNTPYSITIPLDYAEKNSPIPEGSIAGGPPPSKPSGNMPFPTQKDPNTPSATISFAVFPSSPLLTCQIDKPIQNSTLKSNCSSENSISLTSGKNTVGLPELLLDSTLTITYGTSKILITNKGNQLVWSTTPKKEYGLKTTPHPGDTGIAGTIVIGPVLSSDQ